MPYLLLFVVLLVLFYLPQYWVASVLKRYNRKDEANFPGTGGEFARHLLDRFELNHVQVEATDQGDHYDPLAQCVRLSNDKFEGRTLTAITVAAHECGHALQHAARERFFMARIRLVGLALWANRIGSFLLLAAPFTVLITRAPSAGLIQLLGGLLVMGFTVLTQLITLPVEMDASFNKALPILRTGYLEPEQLPAARRILRAAAWTYVASSLVSLLNVWRWLAVLRR